jgi:hypothetical protein
MFVIKIFTKIKEFKYQLKVFKFNSESTAIRVFRKITRNNQVSDIYLDQIIEPSERIFRTMRNLTNQLLETREITKNQIIRIAQRRVIK